MSVPYAWVPYVNLSQYQYDVTIRPFSVNTAEMLRIGHNVTSSDAWIAVTAENYVAKCFYTRGSTEYSCYAVFNTNISGYAVDVMTTFDDNDYGKKSGVLASLTYSSLRYCKTDNTFITTSNPDIPVYANLYDGLDACNDGDWSGPILSYPITYRLTNATTTGPNEAAVGDIVTVPLTFTEGYGVVNPSTDVYVTCNGESVPSTYSDGQLVFTMPDPS